MIFSDLNLSRRLERTEAVCNARFVEARARLFPASRAEWITVGGTYAMFDGAESPCTQTFGLGLFDSVTGADLDKLEAFFHSHDAPVFHEISPLADVSLLSLLAERGYQPIELTNVLFRPVENNFEMSANSRIKTRIAKSGEKKLWARTSANGWTTEAPELSDFMFQFGQLSAQSLLPFLAEIENLPVATAGLFINDGVALLAGASTIPEGRNQGAQSALLDARLRYAAQKGCDIAMMGARPGGISQRNAERNGFRIVYTRTKWQLTK